MHQRHHRPASDGDRVRRRGMRANGQHFPRLSFVVLLLFVTLLLIILLRWSDGNSDRTALFHVANYDVLRLLGQGKAGSVYLAAKTSPSMMSTVTSVGTVAVEPSVTRSEGDNSKLVAMKEIRLDRPGAGADKNWVTGEQEMFIGEYLNITSVYLDGGDSVPIIRFHGSVASSIPTLGTASTSESSTAASSPRTYLLYELMKGGELLDHLSHYPSHPEHARSILYRLLKGLEYLSRRRVVLRDVKLDNILLEGGDDPSSFYSKAKWSDFGDAVPLDYIRDPHTKPTGFWWDTFKSVMRLNEYLRPIPGRYTISPYECPVWAFDMWGMGIATMSVVLGENVLDMRNFHLSHEITKTVVESSLLQRIQAYGGLPLVSLVKRMLTPKCWDRISPVEALASPFFSLKKMANEETHSAHRHSNFRSSDWAETVSADLWRELTAAKDECGTSHHGKNVTTFQCFCRPDKKRDKHMEYCRLELAKSRTCMAQTFCSASFLNRHCQQQHDNTGPSTSRVMKSSEQFCYYHASFLCDTLGIPLSPESVRLHNLGVQHVLRSIEDPPRFAPPRLRWADLVDTTVGSGSPSGGSSSSSLPREFPSYEKDFPLPMFL
eukprot:TRINITY_DN12868_c0_g1_i1.p1 TRINITY_DN12868_c0_g1~~TRINITY_DN12868_c0_g1_i1.p1  ORF type:complete len:605 (-),score=90.84 TRINITY_DN12868_c0_g1_i1:125-1939(-)